MKNALGESNWWLIEKDFYEKIFTVIGPISDDTKFNEKTCLLRKQGRNISIETVDIEKSSKFELIEEFRQMLKYKYVEYDILEN
jgi:hypothetical protein